MRKPVLLALVLVSTLSLLPADAVARFSGGYARPSFSFSSRPSFGGSWRPSFSSRSFGTGRTPGVGPWSGGYGRPSGGYLRPPTATRPSFSPSAGDRALSRQNAGRGLNEFRSAERRPPLTSQGANGRWSGGPPVYAPSRGLGWNWTPPPYARAYASSYGGWNPFLFWFLLDTLSRPGRAQFFHDQQDDAAYQRWHAEAAKEARDNPALQAKLDDLDRQLAEKKGDPRNPGYLPPDVSRASAQAPADEIAPAHRQSGGGWGPLIMLILVGGSTILILHAQRRNLQPICPTGPGAGREGKMGLLTTATDILRRAATGDSSVKLKPFRTGQPLSIDPTPFILSEGKTKVAKPQQQTLSITAVGKLDGTPLYRLHLDDNTFVQIHLDRNDAPDECRYFTQIDEVAPADAEEWKAWLQHGEGMIGWSRFQTKDGQLYDRVLSPGPDWIAPVAYVERIEGGGAPMKGQMMLYAAATGLADPAPPTEYILVTTMEQAEGAWVAIFAGIDVNPAALSLI